MSFTKWHQWCVLLLNGTHGMFRILSFNIEILKWNRIKRIPYGLAIQYYIRMLVLFASITANEKVCIPNCNEQFPDI